MTALIPKVIYVDARALQDPNYRFRGVGQHSTTTIEALRGGAWSGARPSLVGVVDVARPELYPEHEQLFDRIIKQPRPAVSDGNSAKEASAYLNLSPMTHDPVWAATFLLDPAIYRIALFYDLIPMQFPERYLATAAASMDYTVGLAWLRRYDAFAAISQFSADALTNRLAVDQAKVFVSGVAVRGALQPLAGEDRLSRTDRRWVVVSGGGDPRKNPECALIAHAQSAALQKAEIRVAVFGGYPEAMRAELNAVYVKHGGKARDLVFQEHLSDEDLRQIYRQGFVTVVPSRAEGFSIPIVESSAAGTPVLASDAGAHPELARDPAWRFDPEEPGQLRELLERLLSSETAWAALRDAQAPLWRDYTVERVGQRFVEGVLARTPKRPVAPAVKRNPRPRIAVLTPLPPAQSGVADYSAFTLRPLKAVADLHMFTPTPGAKWEDGWASLAPVSAAAFSPRAFDATISVLGNSPYHAEIFDYLMDYGGACLAHDARQLDFYIHTKGFGRALEIASAECGREVSESELRGWFQNQRDLPTLFLSELAKVSSPLIVHSPTTAALIKKLYGAAPVVLPFAQYRELPQDICTPSARLTARKRLGIPIDRVVVTTFGHLSHEKCVEELVWTLKMLRVWRVDAQLVCCGDGNPNVAAQVLDLARSLDLGERVTIFSERVPESTYVDYLLASDVGVQLRQYFMGGLSGALNDCIAAGIPSVANEHLAAAMVAPPFVRRVPDNLSPVLMAEAILDILSKRENITRPEAAMREFRSSHSPEAYCEALLRALTMELAIEPVIA